MRSDHAFLALNPFLLTIPRFLPIAAAAVPLLLLGLFMFLQFGRGLGNAYGTFFDKDRVFGNMIAAIVVFIIVLPPFAFGGVYPWSEDVVGLSIISIFVLFMLRSVKNGSVGYRKTVIYAVFLVYMAACAFQMAFQIAQLPFYTFSAFRTAAIYLALFYVLTNFILYKKELENLIYAITLTAALCSVIALMQYVSGTDKMYWMVKAPTPLFFGTFIYSNHFATYVSIAAFLTLGLLHETVSGYGSLPSGPAPKHALASVYYIVSRPRVIFITLSFSVMFVALILSRSRAGIASFLAVLIFFVSSAMIRKFSRKVAITAMAGIGATLGALAVLAFITGIKLDLQAVLNDFKTIFNYSTYITRIELYSIVAPKILSSEFFFRGTGIGTLYDVLPSFSTTFPVHRWGWTDVTLAVAETPRYIFNDFLQFLIEAGMSWAILISMPFIRFIKELTSAVGKSDIESKYFLGLGCICALLFAGLHALINFNMTLLSISSLLVITLSISVLVSRLAQPQAGQLQEIHMDKGSIPLTGTKRGGIAISVIIVVTVIFIAGSLLKALYADILSRRGETIDARRKAISLQPENDILYFRYYRFLLNRYHENIISKELFLQEGTSAIDRALELNPYDTRYIAAKTDLALMQNDFKEASLVFGKAAFLVQNNPVIQMGFAVVTFWQAIHEADALKKQMLLDKGLSFHKKALELSNGRITMDILVSEPDIRGYLNDNLRKEGISLR